MERNVHISHHEENAMPLISRSHQADAWKSGKSKRVLQVNAQRHGRRGLAATKADVVIQAAE